MSEQETIRTVSFRIGADRYTKLEELRPTQGVRSVSDLIRLAIEKLIEDLTRRGPGFRKLSAAQVRKLERRVDRLEEDIKKLKAARVG